MTKRRPPTAAVGSVACGDVHERAGDVLVIRAAFPIEGLEPTRFRAPVLLVGDERFRLETKDGAAERPTYVLRVAAGSGFDLEGEIVSYDPARHEERRRRRAMTIAGWIAFAALVPLMPLLGLLPGRLKEGLLHVGISPTLATQLSLPVQTLAVGLLLVRSFEHGAWFTMQGALYVAAALALAFDGTYRASEVRDGNSPGAFALVGGLMVWGKALFGEPPSQARPTRIYLEEGRRPGGEHGRGRP